MLTWGRAKHFLRSLLERPLGVLSWAMVRALSRDVTDDIATSRLLVLAPHPDDETLACGGCIARSVRAGGVVFVAVVTDGRAGRHDIQSGELSSLRRAELSAAVADLGLAPHQVEWLGLGDGTLSTHVDDLAERISGLVVAHRPTAVLSPWAFDTHGDHAALGKAARAGTADLDVLLFEYIVWAWSRPLQLLWQCISYNGHTAGRSRRSHPERRAGRPVRVRTDPYLRVKIDALGAYQSQLGQSVSELGLPTGDGPLEARFIRRFLGPEELFIPYGGRHHRLGRSGPP